MSNDRSISTTIMKLSTQTHEVTVLFDLKFHMNTMCSYKMRSYVYVYIWRITESQELFIRLLHIYVNNTKKIHMVCVVGLNKWILAFWFWIKKKKICAQPSVNNLFEKKTNIWKSDCSRKITKSKTVENTYENKQ